MSVVFFVTVWCIFIKNAHPSIFLSFDLMFWFNVIKKGDLNLLAKSSNCTVPAFLVIEFRMNKLTAAYFKLYMSLIGRKVATLI